MEHIHAARFGRRAGHIVTVEMEDESGKTTTVDFRTLPKEKQDECVRHRRGGPWPPL